MPLQDDVRRLRANVREVLAGRPVGARSYRAIRRLHASTGGASSAALGSAARLVPRGRPAGVGEADPAVLAELRRDGITVLPWRLADDVVARLQAFARAAPVGALGVTVERYRDVVARGPLRYDDVRTELPMALVVGADAMRSADLQALVVDARLLGLAEAYLRARPVASPATLTWTTGVPLPEWTPHETRNATLYHWDYDGLASVRVHVYLTDVDEDDAPMRYMRGSHRISRARTRLLRAGDVGHSDPAVHHAFDREHEVVVTGPAGTVFVSDSQGLHRGSPSRGHERLFAVWALASSPWVTPISLPVPVPSNGGDPGFEAMLAAGDPTLALFRAEGQAQG